MAYTKIRIKHISLQVNRLLIIFVVLYSLQVGDRAWFVRLYGEIIDFTGAQTMLYLTCTMISSVDLAHYLVSRAKDRVIYGLWYNAK